MIDPDQQSAPNGNRHALLAEHNGLIAAAYLRLTNRPKGQELPLTGQEKNQCTWNNSDALYRPVIIYNTNIIQDLSVLKEQISHTGWEAREVEQGTPLWTGLPSNHEVLVAVPVSIIPCSTTEDVNHIYRQFAKIPGIRSVYFVDKRQADGGYIVLKD